jgi:DNA-binding transcriptional MerR regulator
MKKAAEAFRTISEVADWLETPAHVLRFWESKFSQVKPVKRAGGRRYYRPSDMLLLAGIKRLLHQDGLTIKDVQALLREKGAKHVSDLAQLSVDDDDNVIDMAAEPVELDEPAPGEPVFTSVGPAPVAAPDPADNVIPFRHDSEGQLAFPGFEFASDRTKAAEADEPAQVKSEPQPIDISAIPDLSQMSAPSPTPGPLAALARIAPGGLAEKATETKEIRRELAKLIAARAGG